MPHDHPLTTHCKFTSDIARVLLEWNPRFSGLWPPIVSTALYEAGMGWIRVSEFVLDLTVQREADANIQLLCQCLAALGHIFAPAKNWSKKLSKESLPLRRRLE